MSTTRASFSTHSTEAQRAQVLASRTSTARASFNMRSAPMRQCSHYGAHRVPNVNRSGKLQLQLRQSVPNVNRSGKLQHHGVRARTAGYRVLNVNLSGKFQHAQYRTEFNALRLSRTSTARASFNTVANCKHHDCAHKSRTSTARASMNTIADYSRTSTARVSFNIPPTYIDCEQRTSVPNVNRSDKLQHR